MYAHMLALSPTGSDDEVARGTLSKAIGSSSDVEVFVMETTMAPFPLAVAS